LVKRLNTNSEIDTITLIFHASKFVGIFPTSKTYKYPKKIEEIAVDGS